VDVTFEQIMQDLKKNTASDEIFGKYLFNLSTNVALINKYRHKITELIRLAGKPVASSDRQSAFILSTSKPDSKFVDLPPPIVKPTTSNPDSKPVYPPPPITPRKSNKLVKFVAGAGGFLSLLALANKLKKSYKKKKKND
jgi:hypothetical protein